MKGAIFIGLSEFVEQSYGMTAWLKALEQTELPSNGEYISTDLYDDSELIALLDTLEQLSGKSTEVLSREFGQFFFSTLYKIALKHVEHIHNLFEFLVAVDNIIHIEVQKADPLAYTPTLLYDNPNPSVLIMRYISSRKMCYFAEGLILGAANHFNEPVEITQPQCMHRGDKHCLIRVEKK